MRRRRMLLLGSALGLGLFVGCSSSNWVAALNYLYGSWHGTPGYMSIHAPGDQTRQTGDSLEIMYPSGGESDWYLVGSAVKAGNTWTGTFEVMSGPTTRQSGSPLSVGADVTVELHMANSTTLHSTISATGATDLTAQWTKVVD